jgi:hypothetical protein
MKAKNLVHKNESAIVLFTRGPEFRIEDDKTGSTGEWKMSRERQFIKVIIYLRGADIRSNDLYIADPTGITDGRHKGRYVIKLKNIRHVGTTDKNWYEFAEGGQSPVRYINPRT